MNSLDWVMVVLLVMIAWIVLHGTTPMSTMALVAAGWAMVVAWILFRIGLEIVTSALKR